jgi:putative oxidoreductase
VSSSVTHRSEGPRTYLSEERATSVRSQIAGVVARWLVGGFFIYTGLNKALHPEYFLTLVHEYDLVSIPFLLNSIGAALPWFEVFCGLLLVCGIAVRGSALIMVMMLVPFTVLVLRRALAIAAAKQIPFTAVKFDCGCGTGEVYIWKKMIENSVLILLSLWLVTGAGRKFCARFTLLRREPKPETL